MMFIHDHVPDPCPCAPVLRSPSVALRQLKLLRVLWQLRGGRPATDRGIFRVALVIALVVALAVAAALGLATAAAAAALA